MFAQRFIDVKKAEAKSKSQRKGKLTYTISNDCKQGRDFDSTCLKCEACGRVFDLNGQLIDE